MAINENIWLKLHYPMTIVSDRYMGTYSGGEYTCWPLPSYRVPYEIDEDNVTCGRFWRDADKSMIGIGNTPQEAIKDLENKISNNPNL